MNIHIGDAKCTESLVLPIRVIGVTVIKENSETSQPRPCEQYQGIWYRYESHDIENDAKCMYLIPCIDHYTYGLAKYAYKTFNKIT